MGLALVPVASLVSDGAGRTQEAATDAMAERQAVGHPGQTTTNRLLSVNRTIINDQWVVNQHDNNQ